MDTRTLIGLARHEIARHPLAAPVAIAIASRVFAVAELLLITAQGTGPLPLLTSDTSPLVAWDGQWYLSIAANGYHASALQNGPHGGRLDIAFFPAWPSLIRIASLNFLPLAATAAVLASVLFCLAAPLIYMVLERNFGRDSALGGLALLAFSPPSFVFSMAYSESLFLVFAGLYFWLSRPGLRPVAAAVAVLTRLTGVALVAAAAASAMRRRERWAVSAAVAGLVALLGWWAYTTWLTGSPTAILGAADWVNASGLTSIGRALERFDPTLYTRLAFVAIVTVASVGLIRRAPELAAYSLTIAGLAIVGGSVPSMPRYVAVAFPAFALISARLGRRGTLVAVIAFAAVEIWFTWLSFEPLPLQTP